VFSCMGWVLSLDKNIDKVFKNNCPTRCCPNVWQYKEVLSKRDNEILKGSCFKWLFSIWILQKMILILRFFIMTNSRKKSNLMTAISWNIFDENEKCKTFIFQTFFLCLVKSLASVQSVMDWIKFYLFYDNYKSNQKIVDSLMWHNFWRNNLSWQSENLTTSL